MRHPTHPFISYLDGYSVSTIPAPENNARRVYESPAGQLWVPAHKGLLERKEGTWVLHPIAEIASRFAASPQRPMLMPIRPVRQGLVLFLLPDGLMAYNAKEPSVARAEWLQHSADTQLGELISFSLARDGGLWVSGSNGLAKVAGPARNLKPDASWQERIPPPSLGLVKFADPIEHEDGTVTATAENSRTGQKVIVTFDGQQWVLETPSIERTKLVWRGPSRSFWAATDSALYQWESGSEPTESDEISARQYHDLAVESAGTFWLATSDGLFRYAPPSWRTPRQLQRINSTIHCLTGDLS
ncbi:hypothetical protein EG834_21225, partial [bacterium]|nr:hypothetical protein [bacterium]